jgi:hypothetical protein
VIEAKEWYGRITGDDVEWLIGRTPKKCPMWLLNHKCKVLKERLGPRGRRAWVEPLLVVPKSASIQIGGNWARNLRSLGDAVVLMPDIKAARYACPCSKAAIPLLAA